MSPMASHDVDEMNVECGQWMGWRGVYERVCAGGCVCVYGVCVCVV